MTDSAKARALIAELAKAKLAYAEAYVFVRDNAEIRGHRPTADDARMGARIRLAAQSVRDPEVVRADLFALIGVPVWPED